MQKILNFGSMNIDRVYKVPHMVTPGETITSLGYAEHVGGKGLNQSIALARAGQKVVHAGAVGTDGDLLLEALSNNEIDTLYIKQVDDKSGHTIIQVDQNGQNSIIFYPGSNFSITEEDVDRVLADFKQGDILIMQNEISSGAYLVDRAHQKGLVIFFNPSPFNEMVREIALDKIDWFLLNEIEAQQITQMSSFEETAIIAQLTNLYPQAQFVITCGELGSLCYSKNILCKQDIYKVPVKDTTGAGDTFTGYFIASLLEGNSTEVALKIASQAASIAVSRDGASTSIPLKAELEKFK